MADDGAVTQQPRSKKRELEEFVRDLDPTQVSGTTVDRSDKNTCFFATSLRAHIKLVVYVCEFHFLCDLVLSLKNGRSTMW